MNTRSGGESSPSQHFLIGGELRVNRLGFGAMQLARRGLDRAAAQALLRDAVRYGVDHIETSDYYGRHAVNDLIRSALHPYQEPLQIVTKVGYRLDRDGMLVVSDTPSDLERAVHDNPEHLDVPGLALVYLRVASPTGDPRAIARSFSTLAALRQAGLIRHLGISNVGAEQLAAALEVAPVAAVQNRYSVNHRDDDALVDLCGGLGIAYVPFGPLSVGSTRSTAALAVVAQRAGVGPLQVALAWLLARSPNVLPIPGTASQAHLRQNVAAARIALSPGDLAALGSTER